MQNKVNQLQKNVKDYKAKLQAANGAKPPAEPPKNAAVAPDYRKFMKLPKPFNDMSAAERKKVLCRFFVNGTCSKGKDCTFGHYDLRDKSKKHIALFPEDARK